MIMMAAGGCKMHLSAFCCMLISLQRGLLLPLVNKLRAVPAWNALKALYHLMIFGQFKFVCDF
jgi:hypothetical protein